MKNPTPLIVETKIGRNNNDIIGVVVSPKNTRGKVVFFKNDLPKKANTIKMVTKYADKDRFILAYDHKSAITNEKYVIKHGDLYKVTTTQDSNIVIDEEYCCMVDTIKSNIDRKLDLQLPWEEQLKKLEREVKYFSDIHKDQRGSWVQEAHKRKKERYEREHVISSIGAKLEELAYKLLESGSNLDNYLNKLDASLRQALPQFKDLDNACSTLSYFDKHTPKSGPKLQIIASFYVDPTINDYAYIYCHIPLRPFVDLLRFVDTRVFLDLGKGEIKIHQAEVLDLQQHLTGREDFEHFAQTLYRDKEEEILSSEEWMYFQKISQPVKNVKSISRRRSWDKFIPESEDGFRPEGYIRTSGTFVTTIVTFADDTSIRLTKESALTGEEIFMAEKEYATKLVQELISSSLLPEERQDALFKMMSNAVGQ
ncbi:hypothetical protein [Shouchella clausii]|uniref:Uncharacterized protein n=1 Tax=Shouchella clausii TaxID=79880 RepID=A0A268NVT9_SHOCL|nr:hypothetical protein [Shouchella clausii]PAE87647.1 hypothetical protein CHH72_17325 [Shouchella clausii]